jgi:PmbA protein
VSQLLENLRINCQKIALTLNIKKYDIFGVIKEENSASSKDAKPFSLNSSNKSSVTLRVWNELDQVGITSTSNLTEEGLKIAFEMAFSSAKFFDVETKIDFSSNCQSNLSIRYNNPEQNFSSIQELAYAAVECEKIILANKSIKNLPYNKISQTFYERFYFNSINAFRYQNINTAFCYFYPLSHEENKIPRQFGEIKIANSFSNLNYFLCAEESLKKTLNHLNYEKIVSGKYAVVFSPEAFLDITNAFSNFYNAQNILDKKSLLNKDSLSNKIANPLLNIIDLPYHKDNFNKCYFDEEGTPTADLSIIENGILKNLIHTSHTAKIYDCKPTGHTSLGAKLTAHSYFLRIFKNPLVEVQKPELKSYVYVENVKALHAGINALQGSFSLPFDGYFVNNNVRKSIESATVAGDFLDLLNDIIYIDSDEIVTPSGISSEIWVKELSITGG